jgi:16S rRNA (uracil1498-N3)-methyltransferase
VKWDFEGRTKLSGPNANCQRRNLQTLDAECSKPMTRRRWIADEVSGNRAALTGSHAQHLARVLRARVGQEFDVAANGIVRRGTIVSAADKRVEFELGEEVPESTRPDITLALSIFKFDRMEWAIEKCTELGASRIVPVIARRTDSHLASAALKRAERWRKIALEAAQQSRRASPPEILSLSKLTDVLALQAASRIVLSESETAVMLREVASPAGTAIAIGPEGGWTEEELKQFLEAGWTSASLGSTILRAETAAIVALAMVMAFTP